MRKIVHLYKRRPELSVEEFQACLLKAVERDPALPERGRFVQSHTLAKGYAKGERFFDVVDEFEFTSIQDAEAFQTSDVYKRIVERRNEVVFGPASHRMVVDVQRVKDTPVPEGAVKNIEFVNRRGGMPLAEFRDYWMNIHGPIGSRISTILRYEQNHTVLSGYRNGSSPRFDGLAMTWFASTQSMREGASSPEYEVTRKDEPNFLPDGHLPTIITREVLDLRR